jgi:transposase
MWGISPCVQILLFSGAVDMRKGPDGLRAIVERTGVDVFSGYLFVFLSRRLDRAKILAWDSGGFVVWYKRLEKGRFRRPRPNEDDVMYIDAIQLSMLLDGIDFQSVRRPPKWSASKRNFLRPMDRQNVANMI